MTRRRAGWVAIGVALLAGCGGGDRLKPGEVVMTTASKEATGVEFVSPDAKARADADRPIVPLGIKVRVVDDMEAGDPKEPQERLVRVNVLEGEHEGIGGKIRRKSLVSP